eukprot:768570-Hanusia_phi.AAC.2
MQAESRLIQAYKQCNKFLMAYDMYRALNQVSLTLFFKDIPADLYLRLSVGKWRKLRRPLRPGNLLLLFLLLLLSPQSPPSPPPLTSRRVLQAV